MFRMLMYRLAAGDTTLEGEIAFARTLAMQYEISDESV